MTERALPVTILEPAGIDPELLDHTLSLRFDLGQFDPRITFTRNSSATYFGSDGLLKTAAANEPRIDYDPVTKACKGFLVEESRTNLLTYSEQFDSATWNKPFNTVTLTNEILSPTGAANAYKIVRTSSVESMALRKIGLTLPAGAAYSASIHIYVPEQSGVTSWSMTNDYTDIESGSTPAYTAFNKWVRVSTTSTLGAERNFVDFNVRVNGTQTPSVGFVFYAWGAQLEAGSFPTSYIKTEATAATRAADSAAMTGTNFSSWYRQDEGAMVAEAETPYVVPSNIFPQVFYLSNGTTANNIRIAYNTESLSSFGVRVGDVQQADLNRSVTGRLRKIAGSYAVDAFSMAANGGAVQTDSSGSLPTVTQSNIGGSPSGSVSFLNGHIKRLAYYPRRLANAKLQALTA